MLYCVNKAFTLLQIEHHIARKTKATNLLEQQFRSDLGAFKINYRLH